MPEGPSDQTDGPRRHLVAVQPEDPDIMNSTSSLKKQAYPGVATRATVSRWNALVSFRLPAGVEQHPRLLTAAQAELGRICVSDMSFHGVRLRFGLFGDSEAEAANDCRAVTDRLLGRLGLTAGSIDEWCVYDSDAFDEVIAASTGDDAEVVDLHEMRRSH